MILLLLLTLILPSSLRAEEGFLILRPDQLIGKGKLNYYLWEVYEASLYAKDRRYQEDATFTLILDYKLNLKGKDIARQSIKEMEGQGCGEKTLYPDWEKQLVSIFPDVKAGDKLSGLKEGDGSTKFYYNNKEVGRINDGAFSRCFFNIWLGSKTSAPELRNSLLGIQHEKDKSIFN